MLTKLQEQIFPVGELKSVVICPKLH